MHILCVRSVPATHRADVLQHAVRRRHILRNGCLSVHELPCWQVFDNRRDLHLLVLRVRSVPASHWADIVQLVVPTGSVLGHHRQCLPQLCSWQVLICRRHVLLLKLCRRPLPVLDRAIVMQSVRLRILQH
jgi:hypothetical protein